MDVAQSSILNVEILDAKLRKEAWYNTFWAKYAGFVDISKDDNGNPIYQPSGKPIEILRDFVAEGRDNMLIPFIKYLTGDPVHGDTVLKGTGEELIMRWLRTYVNQTRKAVMKRTGKMSEQRAKLYKLYDQAKPLLVDYFSKLENMNVFRTFYEGVSWNLSRGTNYDGLGLVKRYHPNWYYLSAAATISAVGTEKYLKTAANLDTALAGVNGLPTTIAVLRKLRVLCMKLKIPQIVTKNGYKFWMLIMHPDSVNKIKVDTDYKAAVRAAYSTKMFDEPELQGVVAVIEGFAIFEDIVGIRAWDGTNKYLFGDTFALATEPSVLGTSINSLVIGNQAVGKGIADGLRFTNEVDDHENTIEIGGAVINGYNRADFMLEADAGEVSGDAFYKAIAAGAVSAALAAVNQSSLILMTDEN